VLTLALTKNARELGVGRMQFYAGVNGLKKNKTKQNKKSLAFQIFTE